MRGALLDVRTLLAVTLLLLLADRALVLARFALVYTDDDQVLQWYAAREARALRFHEPRFYGQAYNTMLEGLLAGPLVATGIPPDRAVPLVTCALGLVADLAIAAALLRRRPVAALAVLAIPCLLALELHAVRSMPRGFAPGIALGAAAAAISLRPPTRLGLGLVALLGTLAISASATAALLVVPFWTRLWLDGSIPVLTRAIAAGGAVPPLVAHALAARFYAAHPDHDLHRATGGRGLASLVAGLEDLESQWGAVVPLLDGRGWILPVLLVSALAVLLRTRRFPEAAGTFTALAVLVMSLALDKTQDGRSNLFYHQARIYLAVPTLLALVLAWLPPIRSRPASRGGRLPALRSFGPLAIVLAAAAVVAHRAATFDRDLARLLGRPTYGVGWGKTAPLRDSCERALAVAGAQAAPLIVFADWHRARAYGCGALAPEGTETLLAGYERRTWRLEEEAARPRERILVDASDEELPCRAEAKLPSRTHVVSADPPLALVEPGGEGTLEVLRKLGFEVRGFGKGERPRKRRRR